MEQLQAPHKPPALEGHVDAVVKTSQIISYFVLENDNMALMTWQTQYEGALRRGCIRMEITLEINTQNHVNVSTFTIQIFC